MQNTQYLLALAQFNKFTARDLHNCLKKYNDIARMFNLSPAELAACGIRKNIALEFAVFRKKINTAPLEERLARENIRHISIFEKGYPALLKEIHDPPLIFFYLGALPEGKLLEIAIVGSRKNTYYGIRAVEILADGLPPEQSLVVSGLALGIDACAHRTALNRGMRTLAVTGSGLDKRSFYPGANLKLMRQMVEAGNAVISEFPPGTPPLKINFPARNRIIAGLVRGVVVIEAGRRSGALITSRYALEFGRDVFALPNDIFSPLSFGPNDLIKRGAVPVTCPEDILEYYGWTEEPRRAKTIPAGKLNDDERLIFKNLCHKPRHANELARLTRLDTSKIMSTLTIMEIKGIVKDIGNLEYVKL